MLALLATAACETVDTERRVGARGRIAETTEVAPSGYVDERLGAHRAQLKKLAGNAIIDARIEAWRHRIERAHVSAPAVGARGSELDASLAKIAEPSPDMGVLDGAIGESAGIGGLGLRGTGSGGGGAGEGIGLGSVGTIGAGAGSGASFGSASGVSGGVISTKKTVIDFADDVIEGERVKLEGAHLKRQAAPLRAGSTDDNEAFDEFLRFLEARTVTVPEGAMKIDVSGRRFVHVVDAAGKPLPGADIVVREWKTEKVVATARTYGDGAAPFYPAAANAQRWLVEASDGRRAVTATWEGSARDITLLMPERARKPDAVPLDVLFLIDTTGSMGDEIDRIKQTLLSMTGKVRQSGGRPVDLRYGAVLYRDVGDAYVTAAHDFTSDVDAFEAALRAVSAYGGGDTPESLNQGLAEAMVGVQWRDGAAKIAFLVADAAPHMDYPDDIPYGESLKDAVTLGVRIHAVAASGLAAEQAGSLVFRQIAQYARGRFIFIEYGQDVAKSAAEHGVTAPVASNNLDDILLQEIRREIEEWGA